MKYGKPRYFTGKEPYCPLEWTPPLSHNAPSEGPKARALACRLFKQESGEWLVLDDYQTKLIDSILEVYPANYEVEHLRGCLRFRQAIVSIPRRNGKSLIASVLVTYAMVMSAAPNIGVLASTKEQAKEVFENVRYNFDNSDVLKSRFKTTNHRGIESRRSDRPAHFKIHAGKGDSLQGITFVGIVPVVIDELHITKAEAYDAAVKGASTNPSAVVVGITTAGTDTSDLLKRLYKTGRAAILGGEDSNPRFGFWHWTVPVGSDLFDRDALLRANPAALANPPRIDIDQEILEGKANPAGDYSEYRRYRRNEFVSVEDMWITMDVWRKTEGVGIPEDYDGPRVFCIDRTKKWDWATITAAAKIDDIVYTERVARILAPDLEYMTLVCEQLFNNHEVATFVVNSNSLKDLGDSLIAAGLPAECLSETQLASATTMVASMINNERVISDHRDSKMKNQLPKAVVRNSLEGVKLSTQHSLGDIDVVRSMVMAVYYAEKTELGQSEMIVF